MTLLRTCDQLIFTLKHWLRRSADKTIHGQRGYNYCRDLFVVSVFLKVRMKALIFLSLVLFSRQER